MISDKIKEVIVLEGHKLYETAVDETASRTEYGGDKQIRQIILKFRNNDGADASSKTISLYMTDGTRELKIYELENTNASSVVKVFNPAVDCPGNLVPRLVIDKMTAPSSTVVDGHVTIKKIL